MELQLEHAILIETHYFRTRAAGQDWWVKAELLKTELEDRPFNYTMYLSEDLGATYSWISDGAGLHRHRQPLRPSGLSFTNMSSK
jgi:hypothetical protein